MSRAGGHSNDFSGRYHTPRIAAPPGVAAEERELQKSTMALLASRPGRPTSMGRFEQMVLSPADCLRDGPVVALFCNFVPEELVEAAGAVPVRLCAGSVVAESIAEQAIPRDICPVVRAAFGAVVGQLGMASQVAAVLLPGACDAKRRLGEELSDYLPIVALSIPARNDHRTELSYWVSELEGVARKLAEITGTSVTKARLRDAVLRRRAVQDAFRDLERARLDHPHVLAGSDLALVAAASFTAEPVRWAEATRELAQEVRDMGAAGAGPDDITPLIMTGAPILWPAWKLYQVIEGAGAAIVADTLCSVTQRLYDPVEVDDWSRSGMMRALALKSFSASLCPCFVDTTAHTDRVLELVAQWGVHGVVAHNLRLCQLFEMQCARLRHILRNQGIPFIAVHTDFGTEDVEQIRVRIEAFLEMIRERRNAE